MYSGTFDGGNGWQTVKFNQSEQGRYLCLEALNAQDGKSTASIAELYVLDEKGNRLSRQNWKIVYADSEETNKGNYDADKVFDLQESTFWSTVEGVDFPHYLVIDLGGTYTISGISYIPRAEEGAPGSIAGFNIYVKQSPFKFAE